MIFVFIRISFQVLMGAKDPKEFKKILLRIIEFESHLQIREVCEAIRQMYEAELIDVIDEVLDEPEPFNAASTKINKLFLVILVRRGVPPVGVEWGGGEYS
jgi:hypothetical protein